MILRLLKRISKKKYLEKNNICIKKNVIFDDAFFEGNNLISSNSNVTKSSIGFGTYLGSGCNLKYSKIGKYCSIASDVQLILGSHPTKVFVSTHPAFYSNKSQAGFTYSNVMKYNELRFVDENNEIFIEIGNDVWIGQGVKIIEGVKIGDGAIIGAYSVVTKDIEPYSINVGTPSKMLRKRFNEDQIKFLLDFKWWNRSPEWISKNSDLFDNVERFIEEQKLTI